MWNAIDIIRKEKGNSYLAALLEEGKANETKAVKLRIKVLELLLTGSGAQCEDILKVFVTSQPISFPTLILPRMSRTSLF
jgi:hypothetical protein